MKSEHRHELKTNELAEWIANFPKWAKENLRMIIYVSVVVVLVAGLYFYRGYQKNVVSVRNQVNFTKLIMQLPQSKINILQAQAQGRDLSFILLQPADNLETLAQDTKDDQMAALALIKRAEALRTELHYRLEVASEQDVVAQISRAKASYTEATEKSLSNPSLMAMAKFGLGLCEEELGNFKQAEQMYRDITANPDFEGTTTITQAKRRLDTMADYRQKVVFKASPIKLGKPAPVEPIMRPEIVIEPPDINSSLRGNDTSAGAGASK